MGLTGKLILPLCGVVLLCGLIQASHTTGYDDVNSLPPQEKRRIIRELLRAQKDIRRALLKVHYSLNGEEFEGDGEDEGMWGHGCSDKELAGYRADLDEKLVSMGAGLKMANTMIDEIEQRVKPVHHGHYGGPDYGGPEYGFGYGPGDNGYGGGWGGGGGGDYGQNGYGPPTRPPKPTLPPLTTTPETTSWRPTTESYESEEDDGYYARNRGANRRYGRELSVDAAKGPEVKHEPVPTVDNLEQSVINGEVAEALDTLFDDKE